MSTDFTLIPNLMAEVEIPENGILSRTLYSNDHVKVVIFGFAAGQELSAHTAPMEASIYLISGEAQVTLGGTVKDLQGGAFVQMAPRLEHGILARTAVVMLLTMYKEGRG